MVYPYCKHHQLASSQTHQPAVPKKLLPTGHWAFQHTADELSIGDQAGTIGPGNHCRTINTWIPAPMARNHVEEPWFWDDWGWFFFPHLQISTARWPSSLLQRSPNHFDVRVLHIQEKKQKISDANVVTDNVNVVNHSQPNDELSQLPSGNLT